MPTVINDETGEEIEVVPVQAVAALASVAALRDEFPRGSAALIEQAMAAAVMRCNADGITDPVKVRDAMIQARLSTKEAIRIHMNNERSKVAAEIAAREQAEK